MQPGALHPADRGMRVVALEGEILVAEGEEVGRRGIQAHQRQGAGLSRQLLAGLLDVIQVQVGIAQRVHELAGLEAGDVRDHAREQCV